MKYTLAVLMVIVLASCHGNNPDEETTAIPTSQPAILNYSVINTYPHDATSFLEGLEWNNGNLFESSGSPDYKGDSKLAKVDLKTGKELQRVTLGKEYFGEGITILNGKIYQLTYKEKKCFVYDLKTFTKISEFTYDGEGWGMTNNGKQLIMDNGTNNLYFRDPETFKVMNILAVQGVPKLNDTDVFINELEWVDGFIYCNVWMTDFILKIDPSTGQVVAKADLSNIAPGMLTPEAIESGGYLNGIAYNSATKSFYVTGKLWPKLFEVKFR